MQCHKLTLLIAFAFLGGDPQTAIVPTEMTNMIVQMSGTDIPTDSFAAKPKVIWRASNQYCRIDEEPDTANIHGRMIINEPDAWLINLADSTARHIVDKGPTLQIPAISRPRTNDKEGLSTAGCIINEPDAWLINLADSTARPLSTKGRPLFSNCEQIADFRNLRTDDKK